MVITLYYRVVLVKGQPCIQTLQVKTEQNSVAALNDDVSVRRAEVRGSIQKQNKAKYCQIINEEFVKEESVRDIDSKVSGINTISGKQNATKRIKSNGKYNLQA